MDYKAAIDYMSRPLKKYRINTAQKADDWMLKHIKPNLEIHQYCAVLSFLTTVDLKHLQGSPWLDAMNDGDFFKAAREMRKYTIHNDRSVKSLENLRRAEAAALLTIKIVSKTG